VHVTGKIHRARADFDVDMVAVYPAENDALVWVDLCDADHDTLRDLVTAIFETSLSLQDARLSGY
jgi:magnesium transporter